VPKRPPETLGQRLDLNQILKGLAGDLKALRGGEISVQQARVRAELAREFLRGVRLLVEAEKFISVRALPVGAREGAKP
jgi:hypothetical protein